MSESPVSDRPPPDRQPPAAAQTPLDETLLETTVPALVGSAVGDRVRLTIERVNPRADLLVLRPA